MNELLGYAGRVLFGSIRSSQTSPVHSLHEPMSCYSLSRGGIKYRGGNKNQVGFQRSWEISETIHFVLPLFLSCSLHYSVVKSISRVFL